MQLQGKKWEWNFILTMRPTVLLSNDLLIDGVNKLIIASRYFEGRTSQHAWKIRFY